ncbi:hypothetical protein C0993_005765 [Termitomyces sp. T159_Od127]|nr:hypothetical protein C0993_005765 [Termitomyces sp. T159_Od127]
MTSQTQSTKSNYDDDSSGSELDEEMRKVLDAVELEHSPMKATMPSSPLSSSKFETSFSDSNNPRRLNTIAGSSCPPSEPNTPSKKQDTEPHTLAARASAVRRAFDSSGLASSTPEKPVSRVLVSPPKNKVRGLEEENLSIR